MFSFESSSDSFETSSLDSFSSSSSDYRSMHDVFISFRGQETRSFVSHLHAALTKARIEPFIDDQLHRGTELGPELFRAIENSRMSIIVFSENYAQSRWCLNELEKIMECHTTHDQLVVPVFYHVDPSTVRHQSGDFGHVLRDTATKLYFRPGGEEKMEEVLLGWRTALTEAADLPGWVLNSYRHEGEVIEQIVKGLLSKVTRISLLPITKFPVGLDTRVQQVIGFIENRSSKVCLIGIWGMSGSGKTTTAKAIYNQIHCKFENRSFIENVTEVCQMKGIIHLQKQVLLDTLNLNVKIDSIADGTAIIERTFKGKMVFIVLDDVTTIKQLETLCQNLTLFATGSVFIVTTRDMRILNLLNVGHVCTVKEMDKNESLELFSWHAFRQPSPIEDFYELSKNVVACCGGLPLALEVLGSYLYEMTKEEWKIVLSKLERIPNDQVHKKLRISYDGLKDMEKDIFLDICHCFIGEDRAYVTKILLSSCGLCVDSGISVLIERSLLKVEKNNKLGMHDLIREIVLESSLNVPEKHRRFRLHEDVHDVLTTDSGTETAEGLVLKSQRIGRDRFSTDSFKKMRYLKWKGSPFNYISYYFYPRNLVFLNLNHSNIDLLWKETKVLANLKVLDLSHSRILQITPDFSNLPNLEKLILKGCVSLEKLHPSIGNLKHLHLLNLEDCKNLRKLPDNIYQLKSLRDLNLSGCSSIDMLEDIKQIESSTTLIAKRDIDEASNRYEKILNQSEDADEKGALVNDVDVNIRMADQIPYAVAESLFDRLVSAAFREHGRIYDVMAELERLKNSVECIRVVLLDAQEKQEQNWITRLKDVLLLADDLLDAFIIEGTRYKVDAGDSLLHQKVALKIEKIQKQFDDVLQEMAKLRLSPKPVVIKQTGSLRNKSISFLLESDITGREVDKKQIINLLRQPCGNISSIAIVGIGGIGKTTLAQFVYNDVEVQNHFEKRMWVCVSNSFDVKTIVKKMLESLIGSKIDAKLPFEYIQHTVRENLTGERYLLVLDDICNGSHKNWTQLRTYLTCGAEDSKVLMTTCSKIVSERFEASNRVLKGLPLDVSWSMFKKITFGNETSGVNQNLESIGKKIAEKCMGVPLAVRTLGGLLQSKSEEKEWINVLQGNFWELCKDNESIMSIMKLSYQSLPLPLRQCFAYCSLFPKDWEIKKDMLIQLWIAQGYLEFPDEKQLLEDVGNEFVKIFLMKSFFQDAKVDEDGDVVSFKMHDLMHDLATQVAGNDCCYMDSEAKRCVQRPMHVSLEPKAVHLLGSLDASRLRTLILLSSNEEEELNGDELSVISKFKHLRVLKLSYCSLSKLSSSIEKLKHLRYLSLSHCRGLGSLYESFSSLVLLQTLILMPIEQVKFPTNVISNLINLRHLHISNWEASRDETSFGIVKLRNWPHKGMIFSNWTSLTNIVEISFFLCGSLQYLPSMERLPFLKSLHISFLEELEYIYYEQDFPSAFFPSLECLSLQFCGKLKGWGRMGDDFNNTNCSQNLSLPPFPCLSQLSIIGCLMLTCMPTFPNLQNRLELYDSSVEIMVATLNTVALESSNEFPPLSMLKSLHIDGVSLNVKSIPKDWMQNLTSLQILQINWFSSQAFQEIETWFKDDLKCLPSLQKIAFHNCEDLKALPDWICKLSSLQHLGMYDCINLASLPEGMLTKLQTLEIIGCPLLVEDCQTQTGETWQKIGHVPKKIFSFLH